jgi:hypothetical protein
MLSLMLNHRSGCFIKLLQRVCNYELIDNLEHHIKLVKVYCWLSLLGTQVLF